MNVLISPLKVVNDALVSKLFLQDKYILEEVKDPLLNVKMIELGDHSLLIF